MIVTGEDIAAVKALLFALERAPVIAEAENNLRTLLRSPRQTEILDGLARTKQGLHAAAHIFLGVWTQQYRDAFSYTDAALASHPNLYMAYYSAGLKALAEGKKELAFRQFKECLARRPDYPPVHRELGMLALELGQRTAGKQHLKIYLQTAAHINDYVSGLLMLPGLVLIYADPTIGGLISLTGSLIDLSQTLFRTSDSHWRSAFRKAINEGLTVFLETYPKNSEGSPKKKNQEIEKLLELTETTKLPNFRAMFPELDKYSDEQILAAYRQKFSRFNNVGDEELIKLIETKYSSKK